MLLKLILIAFMMIMSGNLVFSQSNPDNFDSFVYLNWANDFFAQTDYYFTNGMEVGIIRKSKKPILSKRFDFVSFDHISMVQDFFTPTDIDDINVRIGDRPYAAYLNASYQKRIFSSKQKLYLNPEIVAGIIGQGAFGKQVQTFSHEISSQSKAPQGWGYQVTNDLVLNLNFGIEKGLFQNKYFLVSATSKTRMGTLYTDQSFGARLRIGKSNDFFQSINNLSFGKSETWQLYLEFKPTIKVVGYNATLQGGIFNESPYTINASDVDRLVGVVDVSLNASYKNFYLTATFTWNSNEFETATSHQWGCVGLGWAF